MPRLPASRPESLCPRLKNRKRASQVTIGWVNQKKIARSMRVERPSANVRKPRARAFSPLYNIDLIAAALPRVRAQFPEAVFLFSTYQCNSAARRAYRAEIEAKLAAAGVRDALAKVNFESSRGSFKFDDKGDPLLVTHVVKIVDGKETNARNMPVQN